MQQRPLLELPLIAPAAVTKQRFVKYDGAQAGNGDVAAGVADYDAAAGKQYSAIALGTAKVEAGAAIALGQDVQSDAQGRAIPKAAGALNGRALQAASAAGQVIEVLLIKS